MTESEYKELLSKIKELPSGTTINVLEFKEPVYETSYIYPDGGNFELNFYTVEQLWDFRETRYQAKNTKKGL